METEQKNENKHPIEKKENNSLSPGNSSEKAADVNTKGEEIVYINSIFEDREHFFGEEYF